MLSDYRPNDLNDPYTMYDKDNPQLDDPVLLQEACIDYICDNISSICNSITSENGDQKLQFKEEEVFFHTELSEQLLVRLCEKKKLDDLVLTLFQVSIQTNAAISWSLTPHHFREILHASVMCACLMLQN